MLSQQNYIAYNHHPATFGATQRDILISGSVAWDEVFDGANSAWGYQLQSFLAARGWRVRWVRAEQVTRLYLRVTILVIGSSNDNLATVARNMARAIDAFQGQPGFASTLQWTAQFLVGQQPTQPTQPTTQPTTQLTVSGITDAQVYARLRADLATLGTVTAATIISQNPLIVQFTISFSAWTMATSGFAYPSAIRQALESQGWRLSALPDWVSGTPIGGATRYQLRVSNVPLSGAGATTQILPGLQPGTGGGMDDFFTNIGKTLGLNLGSAAVGGVIASAIILAILLRK
jgi:hypothetical protein